MKALSKQTRSIKPTEVEKKWHLIDADGLVVGRVASIIANILLEDEIGSIRNYLELQRLRYDEKFEYVIDIDTDIDLDSAIIPPMLIQPFIENAIEHGIKHKEGKGNIKVRFKLDNKKISCEIEDDGIGREKAWEVEYARKGRHKSLATEIIRDRIKMLKDHGIGIEGTILLGTDDQDESTVKRLVHFLIENEMDMAEFTVLTPFLHTPIRKKYKKEGRLEEI